jgi:hypothetical protein
MHYEANMSDIMMREEQTIDQATVWPPAPAKPTGAPRHTGTVAFSLGGTHYKQVDGSTVVDNAGLRRATYISWALQALVLAWMLFVQWESMQWFQNVWHFRGRAVLVETGLQAIVWIGMAIAYVGHDWISYNQNCRFRATFDRHQNRYLEGGHVIGELDRVMSVEVRRRVALFAQWYDVRLLVSGRDRIGDPFQITRRGVYERCVSGLRSSEDAGRLGQAVAEFLDVEMRRT